jgi:hypothetical protein
MTPKIIKAECQNCESSYEVAYSEELVSEEYPEICPFCGENIEELSEEEYIDDEDSDNWDDEWKS